MATKYYPPHIGGIESHVRDLSEALVSAGHQVKVISSNENHTYEEATINGVEVVRLPRLTEQAATPIARHYGEVLSHEARCSDLVHFHFPYPWGEFAWIYRSESRTVPYVVTYHTDIVRQKKALAFYRPFLNVFLDRARLIMASSPNLIEHSPFLSSRAEKCRHVDFGLNLTHIADNPAALSLAAELRTSLRSGPAAPDRPLVLFVGRLIYYKGVDVLVEAMPFVDAEFVIVGTGPLAEEMRRRAVELGVADRLHVIGRASDEDIAAWYHAADVLALPSVETSEAFGLVQIEAHAAGTPVVSTLLKSGVPYANLDGITGYSVAPNDAGALADGINRVLDDPSHAAQLGAQAKERALSTFSVSRMVENVTAVYNEALGMSIRQNEGT
ncbi:MAG: glycosyltransferase [Coriobacteriia bacterium]|nr:glycosyltransferase [Coriobacteriia bacterium]